MDIEITVEQRDQLGREVRGVWIAWAQEQPNCKPSWLVSYDELSEPDKEVDRRIGERLYRMGVEQCKRLALLAALDGMGVKKW